MKAAALRSQIEQTLSRRMEAALTPRMRRAPDRLSVGIAELDQLLHGGLPAGAITELVGPASSGRSTLALSFAATRLQEGQVAAWIDASDTLDPASAASVGVPLERLLWVRCGSDSTGRFTRQETSHGRQNPPSSLDSRSVSVDRSLSVPSQGGGGGSPHPRTEARGLPEALQTLIGEAAPPTRMHIGGNKGLLPPRRRDKSIATPGVANRALIASSTADVPSGRAEHKRLAGGATTQRLHWKSPYREEQAATDRLPARRGEHLRDRTAATSHWSTRLAESQPGHSRDSQPRDPHETAPASERRCSRQVAQAHPASFASSKKPITAAQAAAAAATFFKNLSDDRGEPARRSSTPSLRGLDQALRATDLLLQSSGFGVVVLDLASLPPEIVWRIPLSTWFRYRAAAERTRTCFLLLTQHACARSSAELVLSFQNGSFTASGGVVTGIDWYASIARDRFAPSTSATNVVSIRKPPQPEHPGCWSGAAPWAPPIPESSPTEITQADTDSLATAVSPAHPIHSPGHICPASRVATFPRRSA